MIFDGFTAGEVLPCVYFRYALYGSFMYSVSNPGYILPTAPETDYQDYSLPTHPIGWVVGKSGYLGRKTTPSESTIDDQSSEDYRESMIAVCVSRPLTPPCFPTPQSFSVPVLRTN